MQINPSNPVDDNCYDGAFRHPPGDGDPGLSKSSGPRMKSGATVCPTGVSLFLNNTIDLVLCALGMPGMNGLEVAKGVKRICHDKAIPQTPLIILTGWDSQTQDKDTFSEFGVDVVVHKPIEITKLLEAMRIVIEGA